MSRLNAPDTIPVRPTNNVYTALVAICVVVEIIAVIVLYLRHSTVFGSSIF